MYTLLNGQINLIAIKTEKIASKNVKKLNVKTLNFGHGFGSTRVYNIRCFGVQD